ncbi:MAG: 4Fe-4S binding protein [Geobacteraceae bacterium]|nr:4Fe-4S binding protein [Geobacteraceae bacterium]
MKRKIVEIDHEKCDGCGLCVPSCAEGAIRIVDGKAVLAADNLCDGLGACLGECPRDAIRIIEREADAFNETAVAEELSGRSAGTAAHGHRTAHAVGHHGGGCPGSRVLSHVETQRERVGEEAGARWSRLGQWPVQLKLVPVDAPFFRDADLLVAADCVPFAYADFHKDLLAGKALLVGCPKLDDNQYYTDKLTEIFSKNSLKSVTVARMEVPCCGGIETAVKRALVASGRNIPCTVVTVGIKGEIK